ncbi:hypothetical protein ACTVH1_16795 [Gluconobacter cerinus]
MRSVNAYQAHALTLNTAARPAQAPRLNILDTPHRTSSPAVAPRRETSGREADTVEADDDVTTPSFESYLRQAL